ncbi:VWA domain-containing protein [Haemophilus parainfluenzae]|uniref:VWA domain-containing protein n=1 Tax=Haemophilus parainfluenzae TaxID=729 RepID=UPI0018A35DEB|nr:VWA domain-containing protein [Haemophilus parainfluenzae]QOR07656.1 VWA domain-containing protein [Haemophilus parainfluenzae]
MQRLARFKLEEINQNATVLFEHYDEILKIVRAHLPPSTATLFAKPEIKSDRVTVEWYSELEGQPYLVSENESDKATLQKISPLIQQRLNAIAALTQSLTERGVISAEQSTWLSQLVDGATHDTRQIYLVNNEPVITGWGIGKKVEPPAPPPVVPVAAPKHRWCYWLLLLLLLLLGLLAWWWFNREPVVPPKVEPPKVEEPKKEEPKIEEPKPEPPKEEPKVEEPKPEPPKEEPKVEEPKPEPVQEPIKEEPKVEPPVVEPPKEEPKQPPKKVCKPKYKPGETPQMVMVFDNSGSMFFTMQESSQTIDAFIQRAETYGASDEEIQYMQRLPNRLSTAKKASTNIINSIGKNVDIGLVSLRTCPAATNHGFYSPGKRNALKAKIQAMTPAEGDSSGTPLYNGLQVASSMVDGVKRDAFILILSDGKDNCNTPDICGLANQIARQKPRLKVNVVDIGGARAANCVASATGGKVFTANNQKQVVSMVNQAIKPMTKTDECE